MRRLVLACVVAFTLSACGGSPKPIEPTADKASPSPAPSEQVRSTLKPPELPAAAKTNDATGAANFVLYWVKVSNYASLTGDTRRLREISDRNCTGCYRYIGLYERTYDNGGWIKGGTNTLENVSVAAPGATYIVRAHVKSASGRFKPSGREASEPTPAESLDISFAVSNPNGQWLLTQIGLER